MTVLSFPDRVKHTVSLGGSGSLTLGAASSGYQAFGSGNNGGFFPYVIEDGTAWETGYGTYTHSGTTFARTTRTASSTGSALTVSTSAFLYVDLIGDLAAANDLAMKLFITGLIVTKGVSAGTIDVSAGACYVPAAGKIVSYAGGTNISAGSLSASQWSQVYLSEAGAIQVVNNTGPSSTTYAGNARQGGTNSNRRRIGSVLTDGSSVIRAVKINEAAHGVLQVIYLTDSNTSPFRVLDAVTDATFTFADLGDVVPRYSTLRVYVDALVFASPTSGSGFNWSVDGVSSNGGAWASPVSSGGFSSAAGWIPIDASIPGGYYNTAGTACYMDVNGYEEAR